MKATYVDHCGDDLKVVNSARVSFGKSSEWAPACKALCEDYGWVPSSECLECTHRLSDRDSKLIKYLASHGHKSPFNHTFITVHVKAPIFVARQLVKHKFLPWNEISRRYVDEEPEFYEPEVWRGKSADKKQGSGGTVELAPVTTRVLTKLNSVLVECYNFLIHEEGVAPEQARMVLPLSTYTEWFWSGTLGAFADMYNLRISPDTQKETQEIAEQIGELIEPLFPVSWKALTDIPFD